jgi:hypothetical protein
VGNLSKCGCGLCAIERSVAAELASPSSATRYRELVTPNPVLRAYPTALELIAGLHACKAETNGDRLSDRIFSELLACLFNPANADYLQSVLLLALMPAVHANVRQVSVSYPFIPRDDIAQHALAILIQCFRSEHWRTRRSHFAFSATRELKRSLFLWAGHEFRSTPEFAAQQFAGNMALVQTAEDAFERAATLRRFLSLCHERAYLDTDELNLLIELKLDETLSDEASGSIDRGSNAFRQKRKRLMNKLRAHTRIPAVNNHHGKSTP